MFAHQQRVDRFSKFFLLRNSCYYVYFYAYISNVVLFVVQSYLLKAHK